jgi:hypothetical protein
VERKLHNKELNELYSSSNTVRVKKIEENVISAACSAYGGGERCVEGFGGETRGKEATWETQS